jgi:F-type H+-transporting ATPase subunit b
MGKKMFRSWLMTGFIAAALLFCIAGAVSASGGGEGGHGGGGTKGWVNTDTYRVMNFAVLAAALFFLLRKPMSQALDARIKGIREQLSDLETRKKESEKELAAYNEKLLLLDRESEAIVAGYIRQGNEAKERILREAESAAQKLEEQARRNIEQEFKRARRQIQEDMTEKALRKAEALITGRITTDDHDRLIDEYLDKVVAQ